jgi:hypothetical protein
MQHPNPTEAKLIQTANAHLQQLAELSVFSMTEARLRVASASLRTLLVEGNILERAWRASGIRGEMTFKARCIVSTEGKDVVVYCGGGDMLPGVPFAAHRNATVAERSLDLASFCKRPRIQVGNHRISTVEVIKYVANTLGGLHFDPEGKSIRSQKPVFDLLRRLEAGEFGGLPFLVNNRNLLHHEILSIGQVVIRSPEVARLRAWRGPQSMTPVA